MTSSVMTSDQTILGIHFGHQITCDVLEEILLPKNPYLELGETVRLAGLDKTVQLAGLDEADCLQDLMKQPG